MTDVKKLREVFTSIRDELDEHCGANVTAEDMLWLLDHLEAAQKDSARIDWLESSKEGHGFCQSGYGDYRHYALQLEGYKSVREVIDAARLPSPSASL